MRRGCKNPRPCRGKIIAKSPAVSIISGETLDGYIQHFAVEHGRHVREPASVFRLGMTKSTGRSPRSSAADKSCISSKAACPTSRKRRPQKNLGKNFRKNFPLQKADTIKLQRVKNVSGLKKRGNGVILRAKIVFETRKDQFFEARSVSVSGAWNSVGTGVPEAFPGSRYRDSAGFPETYAFRKRMAEKIRRR